MFKYPIIPTDCSAETLFPQWEEMFLLREPLGYAIQTAGDLKIKVPFWGTALDPMEVNERRSDGTIDHDYYIILTKWIDSSPITFRYRKTDLINL